MRARCRKSKYYKNRVQVCERWNDFRNFLKDMGDRPEGYTLERIDNEGDYTPENCKWAPHVENTQNRRKQKMTPDMVREIRQLYASGKHTTYSLASLYNTNSQNISKIVLRQRWKNID
jgi:hypothetical protein